MNDAGLPAISGVNLAPQTVTGATPVQPFSTVTISDPNFGATDTLTITIGGAGGTLSGAGLAGTGSYTLSGTAAAITAALDALSFTPTAGAPGTNSTSTFTLSDVSSAFASPAVNNQTSVVKTTPGVAPTITGVTATAQPTTSEAAVTPFSTVTIGDINSGATDTLTITISGAGGTLSGAGLAGTGPYRLTGTAAAITAALDALSFTPTAGAPGTSSTSIFTLSNLSSAFATPAFNSQASVVDTDPDPGPVVTPATIATLEKGQQGVIATVKPGGPVETVSLKQTAGAGTLSLGAVQANGSYQVLYTAPGAIAASIVDAVAYTVTDAPSNVAKAATANVQLDKGPAAGTASITVGHNQSFNETALVNGLITAGLPGDTETITKVSGNATLAGSTITYTSPASGPDSFTYTVQDQLGGVATGTVNVTVDPGPKPGVVSAKLQVGATVNLTNQILAAAAPGLKGDTLSIVADSAAGALGSVALVNGQLTYSAATPALSHIPANGSQSNSFGYTISDQFGDKASGTAAITVTNPAVVINGGTYGNSIINATTGTAVINAFGYTSAIFATGGNDVVNAGLGNAIVFTGSGDVVTNLQGYNDAVSGGNGNNTVSGSQGNTIVTLGNGNDQVTTGGYNNIITLGSGNDSVNAGLGNETVTLGNGNDAVTASGYNNTITVGSGANTIVADAGNDTVKAGAGTDAITLAGYGNSVTLNGSTATVTGGQGNETVIATGGKDAVTFAGYNDSATLDGNAVVSIHELGAALLPVAITFAQSAAATLMFDQSTAFTGATKGLAAVDTLNLRDIVFGAHTAVSFSGNSTGGTLTVTSGAQVAKIALLGNYLASTFIASSDGSGGTNIIDPPASHNLYPGAW